MILGRQRIADILTAGSIGVSGDVRNGVKSAHANAHKSGRAIRQSGIGGIYSVSMSGHREEERGRPDDTGVALSSQLRYDQTWIGEGDL